MLSCLVSQSCPTLCNPMDCSTPAFLVFHYLSEFAQTHAHWISDAIQPSHPLSSPSPPDFNLSQHQGLFQWVGSLHQVAKYWSFSFNISSSNEYSGLISFRIDCLISLLSKGISKVFSSTTVQINSLAFIALTIRTFVGKVMLLLFNMLSRFVIAFLLRASIF